MDNLLKEHIKKIVPLVQDGANDEGAVNTIKAMVRFLFIYFNSHIRTCL